MFEIKICKEKFFKSELKSQIYILLASIKKILTQKISHPC